MVKHLFDISTELKMVMLILYECLFEISILMPTGYVPSSLFTCSVPNDIVKRNMCTKSRLSQLFAISLS